MSSGENIMPVCYDTFMRWATDHFGAENIRFHKDEICTHSIFTHDQKFHLWMNPSGGKKKRKEGVYRCWKTDKMGSLVSLVSQIDRIPYDEAEELLCGISSIRALEKKLDEYFGYQNKEIDVAVLDQPKIEVLLPPQTYLIDDLARNNKVKIKAELYLRSRKIPIDGLYICLSGDYKNRIIIPYFDQYGDIIYFNGRALDNSSLRYMKPVIEGLSQNNILYMTEWPKSGNKLYITEGEFDAMSLKVAGFYATAVGGKFLSDAQIEMLRFYEPVIATDNDEAGFEALKKMGTELLSRGFKQVFYVRPPKGFKDWNAVLVEKNDNILKSYIDKFTKPFTEWTVNNIIAKKL